MAAAVEASERSSDRLQLALRPVPNRRLAYGLVVALAVPALVTGVGYLVSYPRVAIPVLLYLLAMIGAVALGGILPGVVAAVAGCLGLVFGVLPSQSATDVSALAGSIILVLFVVVAAAFAALVTRAHRERAAAEAAGGAAARGAGCGAARVHADRRRGTGAALERRRGAALLARLEEEHPLREDFTQVQHAVDHAASLTRQLLAFSRSQLLQPTELDVNEVVRGAEDMLRRLIGEHIEFATRLAPDLPPVLADRTQIEQVLFNLTVNAREAMPHGGRLLVETRKVALGAADSHQRPGLAGGDHVELSVFDSGQGMAAAVKAQAFEPFFTTKEGGGTGLGLATVYGIVRQSNGTVAIESEEGEGTRVTILLPKSSGQLELAEILHPAAQPPAAQDGSERSGAVLLVEDDGLLRRFMQEMLELAGFAVLTASNGEEALELFERERGSVDVLLTDIVMPRMSGREVAERVRTLDPHVGVIYTSGYADAPGADRDDASIGAIMLPKPVTAEQLVAAVTAARNREFQRA